MVITTDTITIIHQPSRNIFLLKELVSETILYLHVLEHVVTDMFEKKTCDRFTLLAVLIFRGSKQKVLRYEEP